ncbi:uncharacterized protein LOC117760803 isoform X1 [Hippoglossus hippoglossus]|uniref:uncharacterized protein LOC117760803 isoform X1 n=1 Tax=Hippoglossus hippoglossus TaxID=8267 RepID=UPI00148BB680|nr:uncharacterized protein LOC117760803 isoform X1 [Hippoglossus hippoglossus]
MWLKQSTLVLLTVAVMVVSGKQYVILGEEQRKVDVLGSSLTLGCPLNTSRYERFRLQWSFSPSGSSDNASNISSSMVKNDKLLDIRENHTLPNVTLKNSGWYFCEVTVEIPFSNVIKSNGTQIVIAKSLMEATVYPSLVTSKQANPEDPQPIHWWMWLLLGVSTVILIVLLFITVMLRRRCRSRRAEDQIYANTHPVAHKQPSPRPSLPLDSLKTRSSSDDFWTPRSNRIYANGKWKQKK